MKKYLLNSLLVGAMTFGATGVWAAETNVAGANGNSVSSVLKAEQTIAEAKAKLELSIKEVKEIVVGERNGGPVLEAAITKAETALNAADATVETLTKAIEDLTKAVRSFILANSYDTLKDAINLASGGNGVSVANVMNAITNTQSTSWAELKAAIIDALAVHEPGINALVDAIVQYVKDGNESELQKAMDEYEAIPEAREKLGLSINEVKEIKENGRNNFAIITNALTAAQAVYDNEDATEEELTKAIKNLTAAVQSFMQANYTETLKDAIDLASGGNGLTVAKVMNVITNTQSTNWDELRAAIIAALAVHEKGIEDLVDAIVQYVKDGDEDKLKEAMDAFTVEVAKEKLYISIDEVDDIQEAGRNAFNIITNALTAANGVYYKKDATNEEVTKAIEDLTKAVRSFILANLPDETLQEAVNLASGGNGVAVANVMNVITNTQSTSWKDLKAAIIDALAVHEAGIEALVDAIVQYVKDGDKDKLQEAIDAFNKTTGISAITANAQDNTVYNMAGQRVMNVKKGLYIINGKKQLVK